MIQAITPISERREEWIKRVNALVDQVAEWSQAEGWTVEREEQTIEEDRIGKYTVPSLRVFVNKGELFLNPKALELLGRANGRVDLSAYPSMFRVKLLGVDGNWEIMTDSNIPLPRPWDKQTFVEIVRYMLPF